ncbi:CDP-glucose 4,6-dehydratase [Gammaproteobacteria bacterium]|nr:CDP-glucose 4,6-dehydratase [Gammaproteobacteria bacterium]MDC3312941.1 CDP-glucose 4,6-dehydratase [Gammaproteobacteria bacterium]
MEKMVENNNFWKDKKVLLTGHSGFKGSWLTIWLNNLGAEVYGISLEPEKTEKNLFDDAKIKNLCNNIFCDITDPASIAAEIQNIKPDIVFHLAAQALVRDGYRDPYKTFNTNIMGTVNILQSLINLSSVKVAVMVTTDKVYRNNEWIWPYREDDYLGGVDPYSSSKAASEIVIASYRDSVLKDQDISIASARAGNVIGGGDWSKERLIPDIIRAWNNGKKVKIRNPQATRPWQHVLDPLNGYLILAEKLWNNKNISGAYNFGPGSDGTNNVGSIIKMASFFYGDGSILIDTDKDGYHEAGLLALDPSKSENILQVKCNFTTEEAVQMTISWYKNNNLGHDAYDLCMKDINNYMNFK